MNERICFVSCSREGIFQLGTNSRKHGAKEWIDLNILKCGFLILVLHFNLNTLSISHVIKYLLKIEFCMVLMFCI